LFIPSLAIQRLRPRNLQIGGTPKAQSAAAFRCMLLNSPFANRIDMLVENDSPRRPGQLQFRESAPVRGG
jgi:hypothetical protein